MSATEAAGQTAYCVKCRAVGPVKDATFVTTKNGLKRQSGACVKCGTKTSKIVGKA